MKVSKNQVNTHTYYAVDHRSNKNDMLSVGLFVGACTYVVTKLLHLLVVDNVQTPTPLDAQSHFKTNLACAQANDKNLN